MWQELVKIALLGTERSQLTPEALAPLQQLGIDTTASSAEVVLESAAMLSQMQKAGLVLSDFKVDLPEAADIDDGAICNRISIKHLGLILNGPYRKVLPEFIFVAAKSKKILPPEHLPAIFQESMRNKKLWETALPIIGNRGKWLLQQNKDWNRLIKRLQEEKTAPFSAEEIYPVLENKFRIWGSYDIAFRCRPEDFSALLAFWQSIETSVHANFIQKSLQILLFREEMIKELTD